MLWSPISDLQEALVIKKKLILIIR
jgi:hypothetical protein